MPNDLLFQGFSKGLYRITGEEASDNVLNLLSAPGSTNASNVQTSASDIGSGVASSTQSVATGALQSGKSTFDNSVAGYILGVNANTGNAEFFIGNSTKYINWDGNNLTVVGGVAISSLAIPDNVTANSFHVDSSGNAWWGATTLAASTASVLNTGVATFSNFNLNGQTQPAQGLFGDGSDNSVVFDGAATILGMVPSGNVYTMTRDIFCLNITVNIGITVIGASYRMWYQGTLTNKGTISNNGGAGGNGGSGGTGSHYNGFSGGGGSGGSGGLGGSTPAAGTLPASVVALPGSGGGGGATGEQISGGGAGGNSGTATNGSAIAHSLGAAPGVAGVGGASGGSVSGGCDNNGGGSGATAGTTGTQSSTVNTNAFHNPILASTFFDINTNTTLTVQNGNSTGGGGGAGNGSHGSANTGSNGGGGGGAGGNGGNGGMLAIYGPNLVNSGSIQCNGGGGGAGGAGGDGWLIAQACPASGGGGGGSGGDGGNGGVIFLNYLTVTNTGTIECLAGGSGSGGAHGHGESGGADGGDGSGGNAGVVGVVYQFQI